MYLKTMLNCFLQETRNSSAITGTKDLLISVTILHYHIAGYRENLILHHLGRIAYLALPAIGTKRFFKTLSPASIKSSRMFTKFSFFSEYTRKGKLLEAQNSTVFTTEVIIFLFPLLPEVYPASKLAHIFWPVYMLLTKFFAA